MGLLEPFKVLVIVLKKNPAFKKAFDKVDEIAKSLLKNFPEAKPMSLEKQFSKPKPKISQNNSASLGKKIEREKRIYEQTAREMDKAKIPGRSDNPQGLNFKALERDVQQMKKAKQPQKNIPGNKKGSQPGSNRQILGGGMGNGKIDLGNPFKRW